MKVVLISLFHYDSFAIRLLFSYLRANGIDVTYIAFKRMKHKATKTLKNEFLEMNDYHTDASDDDIRVLLDEIGKVAPVLIGIGLQSNHLPIAKQITQAVKKRFKIPVVWGGAHATIDPENCIKETDYVCVGEGFDALLELANALNDKTPTDGIKNIWMNRAGTVIRNATRPLWKDTELNKLPFASYDAQNKIYIDDGQLQPERNIDFFGYGFTDDPLKSIHQTMTAFGCPMSCSFCLNALTDNHLRRRSVANVIEELLEAKRANPSLRMVFFWDNIFQVNKQWCLEFSKEYKEKINLPFFAYTHPFYIDEETLVALRKAGWIVTVMGIQSGSQHIRKEVYGRNETNEQVLKAARRLAALRKIWNPTGFFRIYYDYVKDNPLEGPEELHEGLDLMLQFPKDFIYQAFNLSFFPNYKITQVYLERGLITPDDIAGKNIASGNNWITTFDKRKEYAGFLRMHEFYYLLGSLAQFKIFPNRLIRKIEKKRWFYNNLHTLYWICKIVRVIDLYTSPWNYVWLGALLLMVSPRAKLKHGTWFRHK